MICLPDKNRRCRITAILLATLCCTPLLTGCDSDPTDDEQDSIDGTWVATLSSSGTTQNITMALSEVDAGVSGTTVSGSGTVASTARSVTFQLTGSYVHPLLSLGAVFDVPPGANPTGTISGQVNAARTEIIATISGPDIDGQAVFTRED